MIVGRMSVLVAVCIAGHVWSGCISYSSESDAGNADACNQQRECNYNWLMDPPPMVYSLFFFDYVCAEDSVDTISSEVLPDSGCFILLIGEWHDAFADVGCDGHCITSGWFCHFVNVETDIAWVEKKFSPDNSPLMVDLYEIRNNTTLEVPYKEKRYHFDQTEESWTWENPPADFSNALRMTRCNGCSDGPHDVVLPLE